MPAFSFEKISLPARRAPIVPQPKPTTKARRGAILQMIDRFLQPRAKNDAREAQSRGAQQRSD